MTSLNGTTSNEEIPTALFSMQHSTTEYPLFLELYIRLGVVNVEYNTKYMYNL
ncbi:hypothetical protein psyc5s11_46000 [Clostridium gelidum]|uniref:Uncharacterized protein n=1 Tax=Clostridium gelidum TaxID=704125 RepID=A0ABN6J5G9_9CLOT|nr:hypothetical protein psyc5s11_46000 [Clostridium gelidum]